MTNVGRKITAALDREYYALVSRGQPVYEVTEYGEKSWQLAESREDAQWLATWLGLPSDVEILKIGGIDGEDLDWHIERAITDDCWFLACVCGWENNEPQWSSAWLDSMGLHDIYEGREESAFTAALLAFERARLSWDVEP